MQSMRPDVSDDYRSLINLEGGNVVNNSTDTDDPEDDEQSVRIASMIPTAFIKHPA